MTAPRQAKLSHQPIRVTSGANAATLGCYIQRPAPTRPQQPVVQVGIPAALENIVPPNIKLADAKRHHVLSVLVTTLRYYEIETFAHITADQRTTPYVECRHVLCYLLSVECGLGPMHTGRILKRDHSSVLSAIQRCHQARAGRDVGIIEAGELVDSLRTLRAKLQHRPHLVMDERAVHLLLSPLPAPQPVSVRPIASADNVVKERVLTLLRDHWITRQRGIGEATFRLSFHDTSPATMYRCVHALLGEGRLLCERYPASDRLRWSTLRPAGQALTGEAESTPSRSCPYCGQPLVRNRRLDGYMESHGDFARRRYCGQTCYGRSLAGRKTGKRPAHTFNGPVQP